MTATGKQTQADRVHDLLVAQIMEGTWNAGEQLAIPSLARLFDVSQTPIREALARLEHTGLVRREALKGYSVAPLFSETDLRKLMEARLVLEPALTVEAGRRVTPEFLEELLGTVERLREASEADGTEFRQEYWRSDEEFHALIAQQSANPFLEAAYRSLGGQVQRFRLFAKLGSTDAKFAAQEHRAIYDALMAREPERAADLMRTHVQGALGRSLHDRQAIA